MCAGRAAAARVLRAGVNPSVNPATAGHAARLARGPGRAVDSVCGATLLSTVSMLASRPHAGRWCILRVGNPRRNCAALPLAASRRFHATGGGAAAARAAAQCGGVPSAVSLHAGCGARRARRLPGSTARSAARALPCLGASGAAGVAPAARQRAAAAAGGAVRVAAAGGAQDAVVDPRAGTAAALLAPSLGRGRLVAATRCRGGGAAPGHRTSAATIRRVQRGCGLSFAPLRSTARSPHASLLPVARPPPLADRLPPGAAFLTRSCTRSHSQVRCDDSGWRALACGAVAARAARRVRATCARQQQRAAAAFARAGGALTAPTHSHTTPPLPPAQPPWRPRSSCLASGRTRS